MTKYYGWEIKKVKVNKNPYAPKGVEWVATKEDKTMSQPDLKALKTVIKKFYSKIDKKSNAKKGTEDNPYKITDISSKEADKVKPNDYLLCYRCGTVYKSKDGYDKSFCSEDCEIEQEELNEEEGRI